MIVPHNNPDPDAIACAVALRYLLEQKLKLTTKIVYTGIIGRAENRALIRYLGYPLQRLTASDLRTAAPIALVDTQPGAGNNPLPEAANVALVIDHHPWNEMSASARFCDVRPEVGAASSMLFEYLQAAELTLPTQLATALFYGIKTDTLDLMRSATATDREAFCHLLPSVDLEAAFKLDHVQLSPAYFKSLGEALRAAQVYNNVIVAYLGPMQYPDLTADMADLLLRVQDCRWVICLGVYKDTLVLSVRTRNKRGAGQLVQSVVGDRGTAGGHGAMAGGQVPLNEDDPDALAADLMQQFIAALNILPDQKGEPLL
ncbi:MAG: DHH family phosphoesterase [Caldilineaceae bacterium]